MRLPLALAGLAWALVAYLLYLILSACITVRRNATKALELKGEDPPFQKNRWPLGLDNLKRAFAA
jgi:hypothetical protein